MKSFGTEVVESVRLFGGTHALWLQRPDHLASAIPGQFIMAYAGEGDDPFLGVAISVLGTRDGEAGAEFGILVTPTDRVTDWLTRRRPGDQVRFVGVLGRGFQPRERVQRMLLVGEGNDTGALVWLATALAAEGREVTMLLSGSSEAEIYPASLLPSEIELIVATEDGSLGTSGGVIDSFPPLLTWCDQAFVSTSVPTQQAIYRVVRDSGTSKGVQVLLHAPMACGTGICDGCAVFPERGGVRLVCTDGPVFDLRDLYA
ncbi:MAG: hypothetical protein O2924_03025 [Chloroflexi bacterium]|nr:hypothetical protein [Chloroflexota bacterium]